MTQSAATTPAYGAAATGAGLTRALAEALACPLVTADAKLVRKLRGHDLACSVRTL